jgi:O-antigen/teichoic acid export membrane protein
MGLGTSLRFIESFYRAAIYGLEHQVWFNIVYSIIQVLRFAGVLLVLFLIADTNIETFFLWQIYISLISVILLAWKTYKVLPEVNNSPKFSLNLAYKVRKFAGGMFFISLTTFAWKQSDQLFLFALLPLTDYGNFMLATTFCSSLILIAAPITQAYFPRLVNLISRKKEKELLTDYRLMSHIILVLIGSVSFLFFTYSYEVVYIWTSSLILAEELKLLVEFLSLSSLLIAMLYSPYNFLIAKGITQPILVLNISGLVIIFPSIFYLVPIYGAIGIILVKIILDILRFFVYSILLKKHFSSLNLREFYKENLIPLIGPLLIIQL